MAGVKSRFGMGQVYLDAQAEARRRGDRRVSTEHIALAMLSNPESVTARALGVDLTSARATLQKLDRQALAVLGLDATDDGPVSPGRESERLRMTPAGRDVFTGLGRNAAGERLSIKHVLLALLARERPDPAAELFAALGVDRDEVRTRLREM